MVPAAVQITQVKSDATWAATKRHCACFARNLEPKFKHEKCCSYLSISIFNFFRRSYQILSNLKINNWFWKLLSIHAPFSKNKKTCKERSAKYRLLTRSYKKFNFTMKYVNFLYCVPLKVKKLSIHRTYNRSNYVDNAVS